MQRANPGPLIKYWLFSYAVLAQHQRAEFVLIPPTLLDYRYLCKWERQSTSAFILKAEVSLILTLLHFQHRQTLRLCTAGTLLHWDQSSTTLQTFFLLPEMYFPALKCSSIKVTVLLKLCMQIRAQELSKWTWKTLLVLLLMHIQAPEYFPLLAAAATIIPVESR